MAVAVDEYNSRIIATEKRVQKDYWIFARDNACDWFCGLALGLKGIVNR